MLNKTFSRHPSAPAMLAAAVIFLAPSILFAQQDAAAQEPRVSLQDAQCADGWSGVVDVNVDWRGRIVPWVPPTVSPGSARGWLVRYWWVERVGADSEVLHETFELVVVLAPRSQDAGSLGAVKIVAADENGVTAINPDGTRSYLSYRRSIAGGRTAELGQPVFMGPLRDRYEFRKMLGSAPPQWTGEIYVGYGLISSQAAQENARNARATQTMLPEQLASIERDRAHARSRPDMARSSMEMSCAAATSEGRSSLARTQQENASALTQMCAEGRNDPSMQAICANVASQAARVGAERADRATRIESQRARSGGRSAGGGRLTDEMQAVCASGDINRLFDHQIARAQQRAFDLEEMARVNAWTIRSAQDSAARRSTCWRVFEWQQVQPGHEHTN